jgi:hypothetical protein
MTDNLLPPQGTQRDLRDQDQNGRCQPDESKVVELLADQVEVHVREGEIQQNTRDGRFQRKSEQISHRSGVLRENQRVFVRVVLLA